MNLFYTTYISFILAAFKVNVHCFSTKLYYPYCSILILLSLLPIKMENEVIKMIYGTTSNDKKLF